MENSIVTEFARLRFKRHQSHPPPEKSGPDGGSGSASGKAEERSLYLDHGEPPPRRQASEGGGVRVDFTEPHDSRALGNVSDLSAALEESRHHGMGPTFKSLAGIRSGGDSGMTAAAGGPTLSQQQQQQMKVKRKAWRRRSKSTSNLANLAGKTHRRTKSESCLAIGDFISFLMELDECMVVVF